MNIFNDSITNKKNKFIMDEFIKYYEYIYANQDIHKEIFKSIIIL